MDIPTVNTGQQLYMGNIYIYIPYTGIDKITTMTPVMMRMPMPKMMMMSMSMTTTMMMTTTMTMMTN